MASVARPVRGIAVKELERISAIIISKQSALGLRDTGKSANSFTISGSRVFGVAIQFVRYLQTNFKNIGLLPKPGKGGLIAGLLQWGKLQPQHAKQTKLQAAYALATSLIQRGSAIRRGTKAGIDIDKILEDSAKRLSKEIADNELARSMQIFSRSQFKPG